MISFVFFLHLFVKHSVPVPKKLDEICAFTAVAKPDVLVFTESWLNDYVNNAQITIPFYCDPFRSDRNDGRRGGGVCVYVRRDTTAYEIVCSVKKPSPIECVWLYFPAQKIVLVVLYIPPNLTVNVYQQIQDYMCANIDAALCNFPDGKLIVVGDFNTFPDSFLEDFYGLLQLVEEPTRGSAILDKCFVHHTLLAMYEKPKSVHNFGHGDHMNVFMKAVDEIPQENEYRKLLLHFRNSCLAIFRDALSSFNWH